MSSTPPVCVKVTTRLNAKVFAAPGWKWNRPMPCCFYRTTAATTRKKMKKIRAMLPNKHTIQVFNKIDLTGRQAGFDQEKIHLGISAKTGVGIKELRAHLKQIMGYQSAEGGQFIARRRHLDALHSAQKEILSAHDALTAQYAGELAAESLRRAQLALDEITGKFTADDLLGEIFSNFCIGK